MRPLHGLYLAAAVTFLWPWSTTLAQMRPLTIQDVMKFRGIETPTISEDGEWVAYAAQPDRGDAEVIVRAVGSGKEYCVSRGVRPQFSRDGRWVAAMRRPPAAQLEKKDTESAKPGMVVLNTLTGDTLETPDVESFGFSQDSRWLGALLSRRSSGASSQPESTEAGKRPGKKIAGKDLLLRNLDAGREITIPFVLEYSFDSTSHFLALTRADSSGRINAVRIRDLTDSVGLEFDILAERNGIYTHLLWSNASGRLAFVAAVLDSNGKPGAGSLCLWNPGSAGAEYVVPAGGIPRNWRLPSSNSLGWSRDGARLFFGTKPLAEIHEEEPAPEDSTIDLYNIDGVLKRGEVDIWNWNDPRIIPNQKKRWSEEKNRTYRAVYHVGDRRWFQLADSTLPSVEQTGYSAAALGRSDVPYLKSVTWEGELSDLYLVRLDTGARVKIAARLPFPEASPRIAPTGRFVAYFNARNWYLYDVTRDTTLNLSRGMRVRFDDEENDTPDHPRSYGFGGWGGGDSSVMLYDRYDVWQFDTRTHAARNVTGGTGRSSGLQFRIVSLDPDVTSFGTGERLLLSAYHDTKKHAGVYAITMGHTGVEKIVEEPRRYSLVAKARRAGRVLFTRQSYTEFPDLWVADVNAWIPMRASSLGKQTEGFSWGSAELVEWQNKAGVKLQGVLITPDGYERGKRYPVLVYFYELSSQRLYEFNRPVVNHRPCFPFYAGSGYAIFLPDVRYTVGEPGRSATDCITSGVRKLIEMGVADPKAIGLHGHSWGGYQTAFIVTQTNMFAAALAGAAVSNMTSAYSGLRLETGLARQFQYEQEQSRIGASLWKNRKLFIENSPVFYADRITTPLLLMFGDEDEAVPWQQGIELYLAMRRLEKPCWLLEYRGEGHHPAKYPNKLDYAIRMKEFFDHYLRGVPAPDWLAKGVPYSE